MSEKKKEDPESQAQKRKYTTTAFPKDTLKEVVQLAQAIQDNNGGQPYNRLDLASALNRSPEASQFRTLIISSGRYGLTQGGYKADKIGLTGLGSSIVAPRSEQEKNDGLAKALRSIEVFDKFFQRFDQSKLPKDELLRNTLTRDFGIPAEDAAACLKILKQNLTDFGILVNQSGNMWVRMDKLSTSSTDIRTELSTELEGVSSEPGALEKPMGETIPPALVPKVFISHSKNKNILTQIKDILSFGQFEFIIAEEVETTAIPIPDKVFNLMRQCNGAIISVSADEKEKTEEGTYRVNPNVLIEIGGAFLAYNKRVILLADKRVALPSNLQGLYRVEYEGDEISFNAAMKLQKALAEFRKI